MGLLGPFVYLANKITGTEITFPGWTLRATYAFYAIHLVASLVVRRRRTFQILIWILLALVIFNLGGCELDQHLH
jgi:peptidoglycan/LPS O-acetylase OafA/YrhL